MARERVKLETRTQIYRLGLDVEVTDYQEASDSSYGKEAEKTPESPYTVKAVPNPSSVVEVTAVTGDLTSHEMTFLMTDKDADSIKGKNPSEELASDIEYLGETYSVDKVDKYHNVGVYQVFGNT